MKNTGYLILLVALLCPSFTRAQVITTVAGRGTNEYTDGCAALSVKLGSPWALAADDKGNIYYSEPGLCVVRKIDAEGKITTVAGNGTAGPVGDGGMATNAQLNNPYGIALDNSGNLYIADAQNNKIRKVDTAGRITSFYGGLSTPFDVAVDDAGNVYVANSGNNQILKISPAKVVTIIASGFSSSLPGGGDCGYSGELWYWVNCRLAGLAVDKKGNVYVADYWENIIRVIYPTGGMAKIAGYPSVGIGGYTGDGAKANSAYLNGPKRIAVDAAGNLVFSDFNNNRLRQIDTNGIITTIVGSNSKNYGEGCFATKASLSHPAGVAFDKQGNLLVADSWNRSIRKIRPGGLGETLVGTDDGGSNTSPNPSALQPEAGQGITKVHIGPNPARGTFTIDGLTAGQPENRVFVQLVNMQGNAVYSNEFLLANGQGSVQVSLPSGFLAGVYMLKVKDGSTSSSFSLVIEK